MRKQSNARRLESLGREMGLRIKQLEPVEAPPWLNYEWNAVNGSMLVQVCRTHYSLGWIVKSDVSGIGDIGGGLLDRFEGAVSFSSDDVASTIVSASLLFDADDDNAPNLERYELPSEEGRFWSDLDKGREYLLVVRLETSAVSAALLETSADVSAARSVPRVVVLRRQQDHAPSSPVVAEFSAAYELIPPLGVVADAFGIAGDKTAAEDAARLLTKHMSLIRRQLKEA